MAIQTMSRIKTPVTESSVEKDLHLYDTKRVVYSKDDVKDINRGLRRLNYKVSGKNAFDKNGNHVGFKCSAKCRPEVAEGHNRRNKNWVNKLEHIQKDGDYEILMDYDNLDTVYKEIFGEALEEYNKTQRSNRRIENYLTHIKNDKRQGSMKKSAKVDNSRKPYYEFIFQIGRRDNRLDTESSKKILKEFCLEWMPKHYPNIHPIGIYLHADESTKDVVSGERLPGSVHVHFVYVPIAHALSKEEQEEEKIWKKELEEKARKDAASKGENFSKEKFDAQDWQLLRARKFGKAIGNGMKLQSSLTGACCEMGFRTKGKLTAQIQMEEAVRQDLLNLVESYGIKVDRQIDTERDEVVSIHEYKKREDNKAVLKETQRLLQDAQLAMRRNEVLKEANKEKEEELDRREKAVSGLEEEKKSVRIKEIEIRKTEEKVAPYIARIDNLIQDENKVQTRQSELDKKEALHEQKEREFNEKAEAQKTEIKSEKEQLDSRKSVLDVREEELNERSKNFEADKIRNEENAKLIDKRFANFVALEEKYNKYASVVNANEQIKINVADIGRQLSKDLLCTEGSWREKVEYAVSNFTTSCQKIVTKLHDAVRGFKTFLQGKTPQDFRKLADDMDRNGTRTFEEYESRWSSESLDWQQAPHNHEVPLKPYRRGQDIER